MVPMLSPMLPPISHVPSATPRKEEPPGRDMYYLCIMYYSLWLLCYLCNWSPMYTYYYIIKLFICTYN